MKYVTEMVLNHIPATLRQDCAFRLPSGGHFFSITVGNIALFRTPGYPDGAKRATADVGLIWPQDVRISVIPAKGWKKETVRFAAIPCFNIDLSFNEAMALRNSDWRVFA